ncbi:NAD(P)/FAD-dependent oxidoreductase [Methylophaga sp.]|uniref:NAD(P)/FAD-dependent oxidoreductase n=1 Tax=Methylophaga sp. TaxID=2024840 RepID=UPI001400D55F|nr:NAD(P)/FAD-dependent oxidoreductase [Methylophaga sp.]MTI64525.1 flavocytochrome C [Methylophaga sp.]
MAINRRRLIQTAAAASSLALFPHLKLAAKTDSKRQRVVVIGGGFAGATAAKYLKLWAPDLEVVMIEENSRFVSCPQSNLVLSGNRTMQQLTHDYQSLSSHHKVRTVQATVTAIDTEKRAVTLEDGTEIGYDRVIVAPGVDFIYDALPMLTTDVVNNKIPHAWKAGPQTQLLFNQLKAMPQGGKVVMTVPNAPFRCPPGPYERACQIALFLKNHNPKGKLIILDANGDVVSKKALFTDAWERYYSGLIDYYPSNALESIDVATMTVESLFDSFKADVLNVIPPQKAGKVADLAGVINVDRRWCEVDFRTYESTAVSGVHVVGDAVASNMPKSGHIANSQAKVCAAAVIALLKQQPVEAQPKFGNTCYSFVDANQAGHVAAVFGYDETDGQMNAMPGAGATSVATEMEGRIADAWAQNIWSDILR